MFNFSKKSQDTSATDSSTENKTDNSGGGNMNSELEQYKSAFAVLKETAERVRAGDMEARIINWDEFGELSSILGDVIRRHSW